MSVVFTFNRKCVVVTEQVEETRKLLARSQAAFDELKAKTKFDLLRFAD